jgi:hypothetical protein
MLGNAGWRFATVNDGLTLPTRWNLGWAVSDNANSYSLSKIVNCKRTAMDSVHILLRPEYHCQNEHCEHEEREVSTQVSLLVGLAMLWA